MIEDKILEQIINRYQKRLGGQPSPPPVERAFLWLLIVFRRRLPAIDPMDPTWFHKAFRQIDVIEIDGGDSPDMDMVFWLLLDSDHLPIFWDCYAEACEYFRNISEEKSE